ncbi:MAG: SufE family protein [Alphaproteobacteria bacterium]|nr:SufE family protein [Alphaproteobacteria bacterium]
MPDIDELIENFSLIEDWEERYRYVIELGKELEPLPEAAHNESNKVRGCASQVWVETNVQARPGQAPVLSFRGDSDAHIVKGLVLIVLAYYSGRGADEILQRNALDLFEQLGLSAHLTPQRSNGVHAMIERIRADARTALLSQS